MTTIVFRFTGSEAEFCVVDVGELDQEPVGLAAAVLEVLLLEAFGEDGLELLFRGAGSLRVVEVCCVGGGKVLGDAPDAPVVRAARRGGEPEPRSRFA